MPGWRVSGNMVRGPTYGHRSASSHPCARGWRIAFAIAVSCVMSPSWAQDGPAQVGSPPVASMDVEAAAVFPMYFPGLQITDANDVSEALREALAALP